EAMTLLVDKNADVNTRNGAGETALMFAATNGSRAAVKFLIDHGADAKATSKRSETALGNAGTSGVEETVRMLLDQHADVNSRNIRGYSPLMLAASSDTVPAGAAHTLLPAAAAANDAGGYYDKPA